MTPSADRHYLANIAYWRRWPPGSSPIDSARIEDVPEDLAPRLGQLEPPYQQAFLAWYPALAAILGRRRELLNDLIALVSSGRAASAQELEIAMAFSIWTAEIPAYSVQLPHVRADGADGNGERMDGEYERIAQLRAIEQSNDVEVLGEGDYADHDDRLSRLHDLFTREVIPWQALDLWFVVQDDTCPLFDEEETTKRAPLLRAILTCFPEVFSTRDLSRACSDPEVVTAAVRALEEAEIVVPEGTYPDSSWRMVQSLDELRGGSS